MGREKAAVALVARAREIANYLAVKFQSADADEASKLLASALEILEGKDEKPEES